MSSRGKKITSTLWYSCDKCCCYISHKDLQDHQLNYCTSINENNVENIICDWKQVFIRNGTFYGFLEDCKLPDSSNIISSDVILLSQSAMQLCQFVIGDPVVIASKVGEINTDSGNSYFNYHHEVKIVWPTVEGAVTSAFCPKQGLELSWGLSYGPVQVMKLQSSPIPASDIVFNFTKSTDVPEKIDCFINLLRFQMIGKIFHVNSRIAVEFYGKKLKLIISNIEPSKSNAGDSEVDSKGICDLIEDMKKLDMSMSNFVASSSDSSNSTCSVGGVFYQCFENTKWCLRNDLSNMISSESKTFNQGKWNLNDIGGYKDVLNDLDYMINSSLKKSDNDFHFKSIRSAKGVLLYGLHGVGKTHIAHALAYRSRAYIVAVQSSNLFSKFYGEAESRLRSIFEEALLHTPSFMILDDIDTICPKRGGSDQERRVVATLLSLLDSLDGHDVFVLATTSQIHIIDPAIRRPGRLDHEIELSVPSLSDREDILMKMLKQPGLFDDEDVIRKIASVAHGYVGADLSAVVAQAFTRASQINDNVITADILQWALTQVKPSAMREVLVKVPNVKWSDIGGQDRLKLQLRQAVEWPLNHPEAFARLGITPPRGILMFGPPGCSKTMIAKALATESKLNFISIKGPELFSKWVGESERAVRAVFKRARSVAPSIVFLDELDAIAGERSSEAGGSANVQERVLAQLLTELDGVEPLRNVIIVAATNRPDRIDKALLRPGRLDRLIYVPLPDLATRRQILQLQFHKTPVSSDVDVNMLADLMDGYSGAEVVATCHEAALNALEEDSSACEVKLCNFEYALSIVTPRTPKSILDLYERYISQ